MGVFFYIKLTENFENIKLAHFKMLWVYFLPKIRKLFIFFFFV